MNHELPTLVDDGLITEEIGGWGEEKYRLLGLYAQMFAASMKDKWECRTYIDLFAGSGRAKIKGANRIVSGSPLVALSVNPAFDKYIFSAANVSFVSGNANESLSQILEKIPQHTKDFRVLSLCFVDPYNLKDLAFGTIDRLSSRFVDFLVLIATDMDATRNVSQYERPQSTVVECFLSAPDWREDWAKAKAKREGFNSYLMNRFSRQMEARKYLRVDVQETKLVRSTEKNLPLYRLALFTRHPVAKRLWEQTLIYGDSQRNLFSA